MSIRGGEFDTRQPDDQHEKEKVLSHHHLLNGGGSNDENTGGSPPSTLIDLDNEDQAADDDTQQLHAPPPVGIRPIGHYPAPSSVQAPKPLSESPMATIMKQRLKAKALPAFLSSPKSSPGTDEGSDAPTISTNDRTEGYHNEQTNQNSHQQNSVSTASLVVCGVDGTVYTLDAYTGQLRGMFASGPALVSSSSSDDNSHDKDSDVDETSGQGGDNSMMKLLNDDESNAITSNLSPGWKEQVVPDLNGRLYSLVVIDDMIEQDDDHDCQTADDGEYDDLDGGCDSSSSSDGHRSSSNIAPRLGTFSLKPLPIDVKDVVDSPISTCRPTDGDTQQEQCGIIVGSKKTTIYAINPTTGKVTWTQDPNGGAGGRGFTTRPPKNSASRGRTVLLQREDYAVRHLDTDGGEEVWKVELGRFSALDFGVVDSDNNRESGGRGSGGPDAPGGGGGDGIFGGGETASAAGGRRRGAAAAAASVNSNERKTNVPPILGGRKKTSLHDFDSGFGDDRHSGGGRKESLFEHQEEDFDDHSHFRAFPSIAFGEDGTSLMAVDGISGELLWKRRIESVIAAVYGVGKQSSWVTPVVIDESDIFSHGHISGLLPLSSSPTSSPHSGGLIPYGAGQVESEFGKLRLGKHHTNLFVSSTIDPSGGYDSHPLVEEGVDSLPYVEELDTPLPPRVSSHDHGYYPTEDGIFTMSPAEMTMAGVRPPSHRTEHGLYLTWSMVAAIVMILMALVVFVARLIILRQKRKWEHTPSLDPTTAPSSSEDGRERSQSSGSIFLPPAAAAQNLTTETSTRLRSNSHHHPAVTRSFSLDTLSISLGSLRSNVAKPSISEIGAIIRTPKPSGSDMPPLSLGRGTSTPTAAATTATTVTTGSPVILRSKTLPTEASPPDEKSNPQQSLPGVDNIDGIPLVRYSRYTSEFEEKSALGSGGFGTVFQCKNTLDSREYAIKKIKIISQSSVDGTVTKHFSQKLHRVLREVKILALLDHPNIVRYYTAWLEVDDGTQHEDDGCNNTTSSLFDRKSQSFFSSSLFSGFGSNSRAMQTSLSPKRNIHLRPSKGLLGSYNPLGWNNFGSFRLDESRSQALSSFGTQNVAPREEEEEDLGFTWERSNENTVEHSTNAEKSSSRNLNEDTLKGEDSQSSSGISSVDSEDDEDSEESEDSEDSEVDSELYSEESKDKKSSRSVSQSKSDKKRVQISELKKDEKKVTEARHILFIQMQLCSSQTLADFLINRQARSGSVAKSLSKSTSYDIDIPLALRLFAQIAKGVKYVHKQGLIHRDLKPQNCFIDDAGNAKVGDFGLSRSTAGAITDCDENDEDEMSMTNCKDDSFAPTDNGDAENTAGVGTRTYASPEQMRGSNYDASTDVYSLGLILFELCSPPIYTAMERYKEFGCIRTGKFPASWNSHIKSSFPTLHDLLVQMISDSAAKRPTADAISDHIDSLLREYSIQSLDKAWGEKGALLLRVEAEEKEGVLADAMKLIKEAAPQATILQYGLRGQASRAIMEFALETQEKETNASVEKIISRLQENAMLVRRVSG